MKILVACEESQAVTKEFRALGFEAYSCDLLPCSGGYPEWHIQNDVTLVLKEKWDMIIAFPPCTDLASSGAKFWEIKQKDGRQKAAIDFFMLFINHRCNLIAVENPSGILNTIYRKPNQIIHPYHFGEPFQKRTCLWLKNLPLLKPQNVVEPTHSHIDNTRGGLLKDGTRKKTTKSLDKSVRNPKLRSKTFSGIAKAMAEQWSGYLLMSDIL